MLNRTFRVLNSLTRSFLLRVANHGFRVGEFLKNKLVGRDVDSRRTPSITGSSMIFLLMVSLVIILLWATKSDTSSDIQLFTFGGPSTTSQTVGTSSLNDLSSGSIVMQGEILVVAMAEGFQEDLFAISHGIATPIRFTSSESDDRDPCWSPNQEHLAFSSHRDGNWEIYVLSIATGQVNRLTYNLAYEGKPAFSPDGQWIAYEAYYENNLDIYVMRTDGSEGPFQITTSPAADHSPVWTPDIEGRQLVYISSKEGLADIYLLSLDDINDNSAENLTNTPWILESTPVWGIDGKQLLFSTLNDGESFVYAIDMTSRVNNPLEIGNGGAPLWASNGSHYLTFQENGSGTIIKRQSLSLPTMPDAVTRLDGIVSSASLGNAELPVSFQGEIAEANLLGALTGIPLEEVTSGRNEQGLYLLFNLTGVENEAPYLSDLVDGSFNQLRENIQRAAGWDVLSDLSVVWSPIGRPLEPGQDAEDWHKAGRAFSLNSSHAFSETPEFELVPRNIGPHLYWDVFVRCSVQDGSLGEPMRDLPWDFEARFEGTDSGAYENGGKWRGSIPSGYYVNFTDIAARFGWTPAYSDSTWIYNWPGVRFWEFSKSDGLTWREAMLQLYTEEELSSHFGTD